MRGKENLRLFLCLVLVTNTVSDSNQEQDISVEERVVDDLTDLLFTSMQSMVSLNKLVTELTEDVSRLTLSLAHLKEETTASRNELEKKISDVTADVVTLKDSDTCEELKSCRVKEEEKEEDEEEDAISPIDGAWSCWTDWPDCSADCGGGNQTRTRTCSNPAPILGGAQCEGNNSETQVCNSHACPIDGGWTNWTDWTNCSALCGGGNENRSRTCTNPVPAHGGAPCEGNNSETQNCNRHACPVDGGWTIWTDWTDCSADCGGGNQTRTRTCSNPASAHGGAECDGISLETQVCNSHDCPINGGWTNWTEWSNCSAVCGGGIENRTRTCTNPVPAHGGAPCEGNSSEAQYCNRHACPVDGGWTNWVDWTECSADCGGGNQRRIRTCSNPAPAHGGAECGGISSESRNCNNHACPIDGRWSNWSDWSSCVSTISEQCAQGSQIRSRSCSNPAPAHGGTDCLGNTQETQYCITCPVKVLKFVESSNYAYIGRRPDMSPLQEELSVCAWVKKLRSGGNAIWFDYSMSGRGDAMCISDTENWNCMINQCHNYHNRVTVTMGRWHHHCSTWRRSTGTWRVYHDGVMLGEQTRPGGVLKLGGYLTIGNEAMPDSTYQFGGEMTKLNVFSKELTAAEVRAMKDAGIFSNIERNHEADRYFKWEDILTWERGGTIRERTMTTAD